MGSGWGGPGNPSGTIGDGPDWAALAAANERDVRRKQRLRIAIGAVSAFTVAGIVAVAVAVQGSGGPKPADDQPVAAAGPASASGSAPASTSSVASSVGSAGPAQGSPSDAASTEISGVRLGPAAQAGPVAGHSGPALTLGGTGDGYAEATSAAVDTSASFTVSAVVRNNAATAPKAAVSQGGDAFFSFYLGRDDSSTVNHNRWVFKVQTAAEPGKSVMALSTGQAALGQWTTLTGVYDAKAKAISLYVDGALARTVPVPGILASGGPVEIGRARYKSHWVDAWNGSVADVQIWEQPLTPTQVARLAKTRSADVPAHATWFRS